MDADLDRFIRQEISRGLGERFEPRDLKQLHLAFLSSEAEGITPLLIRYARDAGWSVPEEIDDYWRDHVTRIALYRTLIRQLESLRMPYVVMKGEPLSLSLYDDSSARTVTDLDILVPSDQVHPAIAQLRDLGFRQLQNHDVRPWAYNQVALRHVDHGAILELHWRLTLPNVPSPKTNDIIRHRSLDAQKVPTMNTTHRALLLSFHLFQHHGFIKGVFDCAAFLTKVAPDDLDAARYQARELGVSTIFLTPFALLADLGFKHAVHYDVHDRMMRLLDLYKRPDGYLLRTVEKTEEQAFKENVAMARFLDHFPDRVRATARPLFFGPHRVGNFLGRRFGRNWW